MVELCLENTSQTYFSYWCDFRPKTGFQLWLEENRKNITADDPDLEEADIIKEAMGRFRTLSAEERLVRDIGGFRDGQWLDRSVKNQLWRDLGLVFLWGNTNSLKDQILFH